MNQSRYEKSRELTIIVFLFFISFLLCSIVVAKEPLELNTSLMEATFKLQGKNSTGTAFIIGRPTKQDPTKGHFVLVTAAHVLEEMQGSQAQLILRKKRKDGRYARFPYSIKIRQDGKPLWIHHDDKAVDVAAMYVALPKDMNITLLPIHFLADDTTLSEFEIHPGDQLMCLGYPFGAEANEAGFPILRSGKIASYPLIPTKQTKTFLYDFQIFKGNSGGPVYFVESGRTYEGSMHVSTIQFIAGLVSKEWEVVEEFKGLYEEKKERHPLGLAQVVHAIFIKETIEKLPELGYGL